MANRDTRIDKCAERTGISRGHISRVLNGKRVPSFTVACKIADGMNIGLDALRREIEGRKAKGVPSDLSAKISEGVKRSQAARAEGVEA